MLRIWQQWAPAMGLRPPLIGQSKDSWYAAPRAWSIWKHVLSSLVEQPSRLLDEVQISCWHRDDPVALHDARCQRGDDCRKQREDQNRAHDMTVHLGVVCQRNGIINRLCDNRRCSGFCLWSGRRLYSLHNTG